MTIQEQAEKLAEMTGASVEDVLMLAKMATSELEADGGKDTMKQSSDSQRIEIAQAYAAKANRKIQQMGTAILTRPAAKQAMCGYVYQSIKGVA